MTSEEGEETDPHEFTSKTSKRRKKRSPDDDESRRSRRERETVEIEEPSAEVQAREHNLSLKDKLRAMTAGKIGNVHQAERELIQKTDDALSSAYEDEKLL